MKAFLIILLITALDIGLFAQDFNNNETFILNNLGLSFIIDGAIDEWENQCEHNLLRIPVGENPSLDSPIWKGVWDDDGIYIAISVKDDIWILDCDSTPDDSICDQIQIFIRIDRSWNENDDIGYYYLAPAICQDSFGIEREYTSGNFNAKSGIKFSENIDAQGFHNIEYFIPFLALPSRDSNFIDPWVTTNFGFDIVIQDVDTISNGSRTINRLCWSNSLITESINFNYENIGLIHMIAPSGSIDCPLDNLSIKESKKYLRSNLIINQIHLVNRVKTLSIYNNLGAKVFEDHNRNSFNISFLSNGIYLVKITDNYHTVSIEKFIKH